MPDGSPVDTTPAGLSAAVEHPLPQDDTPPTITEAAPEPNAMVVDPLAAPPEPAVEPEPQEPPPVFHLDESRLQALGEHLVYSTSAFKVEQLEQLRAICLNCIWNHRGDWDRDAMIGRMMEIVTDFVQQVQQVGVTV